MFIYYMVNFGIMFDVTYYQDSKEFNNLESARDFIKQHNSLINPVLYEVTKTIKELK